MVIVTFLLLPITFYQYNLHCTEWAQERTRILSVSSHPHRL